MVMTMMMMTMMMLTMIMTMLVTTMMMVSDGAWWDFRLHEHHRGCVHRVPKECARVYKCTIAHCAQCTTGAVYQYTSARLCQCKIARLYQSTRVPQGLRAQQYQCVRVPNQCARVPQGHHRGCVHQDTFQSSKYIPPFKYIPNVFFENIVIIFLRFFPGYF